MNLYRVTVAGPLGDERTYYVLASYKMRAIERALDACGNDGEYWPPNVRCEQVHEELLRA